MFIFTRCLGVWDHSSFQSVIDISILSLLDLEWKRVVTIGIPIDFSSFPIMFVSSRTWLRLIFSAHVKRCIAIRVVWIGRRNNVVRSAIMFGRRRLVDTKLLIICRQPQSSLTGCSHASNARFYVACADATGNPVDCHLQEFACGGGCIPRSRLCDHEVDCTTDGADESPHLCSQCCLWPISPS